MANENIFFNSSSQIELQMSFGLSNFDPAHPYNILIILLSDLPSFPKIINLFFPKR